MSEQYKKVCEEQQHEKLFLSSYSQTKQELVAENTMLREAMARDPFVLVLIDGDGMIVSLLARV
jgi:hypothetical protein